MEKKRPPDPKDWDLNTSSTDDKVRAYEAVANAYHARTQPAIFLTQFPTRRTKTKNYGETSEGKNWYQNLWHSENC